MCSVAPRINGRCGADNVLVVNATELFQLKCDVTGSPVPAIHWNFNVRNDSFIFFLKRICNSLTRIKYLNLKVFVCFFYILIFTISFPMLKLSRIVQQLSKFLLKLCGYIMLYATVHIASILMIKFANSLFEI